MNRYRLNVLAQAIRTLAPTARITHDDTSLTARLESAGSVTANTPSGLNGPDWTVYMSTVAVSMTHVDVPRHVAEIAMLGAILSVCLAHAEESTHAEERLAREGK